MTITVSKCNSFKSSLVKFQNLTKPVSYTHLDVYKRQLLSSPKENTSTSPMLPRSSYTSLSNMLLFTNFLKQLTIRHPI